MTPQSFHTLAAALQPMPAAMLFSTQLRPTGETPHAQIRFGCEVMESLATRANRLTSILTEIPGYDHCGLNE
jgi:hypothetical protein